MLTAQVVFTPGNLKTSKFSIPVFSASVPCGQPERIEDHNFEIVDLNKYLIRKPRCTYGLQVRGDSMSEDGIEHGDLLIVEKGTKPREDDICIFEVDGDYTVKRLVRVGRTLWLVPSNRKHRRRQLGPEQECKAWGVVRFVIKQR